MHNRTRKRWGILLGAIAIPLPAFLVRALPYRNFLDSAGDYLFYGPDSYDHLRRIVLGITNFPHPPFFDSYYGYPAGSGLVWSSFLDYLISVAILACSAGKASISFIHAFGFWFAPAVSALTVVLVFLLGRALFGTAAGIISAFILSLLPGHILYSIASELDNNVVEPAVCLVVLLVVLNGASKVREDAGASLSRESILSGLCIGLAVLFWRGSTIFWGVVFSAVFAQSLADSITRHEQRLFSRYAQWMFVSAAATILPFCLFGWWGDLGIRFNVVSGFHIAVLLVMCVSLKLIEVARTPHGKKLLIGAPLLAILAVYSFPGPRRMLLELVSGLMVVGGKDPWVDSISEYRPMLFPEGKLNLWHATETLSLIYWLIPLLLIVVLKRWRESAYADFRLCQLFAWGVMFAVLPIFRERYVHLTAVVVAVLGGMLFSLVAEFCAGKGWDRHRNSLAAAVIILCLLPTTVFLCRVPEMGLPDYERYDLMETLRWMRVNTPPTSYYQNPVKVPEYGVLAPWSLGGHIDYVAQRPTVATNFGWETYGLFPSVVFFTLSDPEVAYELLRENRVRYVLVNEQTGTLPAFRAIAEYGIATGRFKLPLQQFKPLASMYYRLLFQNGSSYEVEDVRARALGGFRLVYESRNGFADPVVGTVSYCKIFENVPGAFLTGPAPPGTRVELNLKLKGPAGKVIVYRDTASAGGDGRFIFRVPYSTASPSGIFSPEGPYLLKAGQRMFYAEIGDQDIFSGRTVNVGKRKYTPES